MKDETRRFWDSAAEGWKIQVGERGDWNRFLCSDPVLWAFAGDVAGGRVAAKRDGRVVDVVDLAGAEALRDPELALRGLPELAARELLDLRSGEPVLLREVHHRLALAERSDGVLGRRAHALVGHELQDVVHRALARRFHDDRAHLVPAEERAVFLLLGSERRGRDDECRRGELQGLTHGYLPQLG